MRQSKFFKWKQSSLTLLVLKLTHCSLLLLILFGFSVNALSHGTNPAGRWHPIPSPGNDLQNAYCGTFVFDCHLHEHPDYPGSGYYKLLGFPQPCSVGTVRDANSLCVNTGINEGANSNLTCNPINISSGNKFFQFTDYRDNQFLYTRSYNSMDGSWRFSYQQHLTIHDYFYVLAERIDGKGIHFTYEYNGDHGQYHSSTQRREQLTFDGTHYTLTFPDNTTETYDSDGRLLSIIAPNMQPVELSYVDTTVIVTKGSATLTFTVSENNEVTQATVPDGSSIVYDYQNSTGQSLLTAVTKAEGVSRRYFYEDPRFPTYITGIEDENGNRISSVQYNDQGRAISSEKGPLNSGIERTQIQYNADGTRTVTNALGKQSTYHFTQFNGEYKMTQVEGHPSANCAGANKNYTYDANGFMASKTDWNNNVTTYVHNDRGQELSRTEASGTSQARTITTQWHSEFNLPIRITEPERETVMTYDANGRLLSRTVNERGL